MNIRLFGFVVLIACASQGNKTNKDVLQMREPLSKIEVAIKFDSNRIDVKSSLKNK